ncbi:dual specificity protein phosphatase family protein [Poritiphilus flavus]|uniref:Protein tyrosine phosphatase n=1 Tax=Poritiphilus flavus TaxID=2697053 RepID=A0A6L9EF14_9FLAO|nr:tyrosine-protein phosphatase [Poritiphilus flavus]NAS13335.1 protein tyrosine phosphatase [Poritiphilus flavus]
MKYLTLTITIILLFCLPYIGIAQEKRLERIDSGKFKRLYQLNDSLYRSEQPSKKDFKVLQTLGIRTSINLRRNKDDSRKAKGTEMKLVHIPLKTKELTEADLLVVLQAIQKAEKPVLVHCWHGSDRTGATMAAYRVVVEDWSKEEAISELRQAELGYHENWYPNVIELISSLDVARLRSELGM